MHITCIKHGRDIKTQHIGWTSILPWGKDWSSIRLDRTPSYFKKHFQLIVFRKLLGWKLEKSYTRKFMRHLVVLQRSPWNMTGWKNWVQEFAQRPEKLPQPDRLTKICTDAGSLKTVEIGQYFMSKLTDEFLHYAEPVTCREYTLPRDDESTDPKGWIQGNTKIGPVLEVTTSYW